MTCKHKRTKRIGLRFDSERSAAHLAAEVAIIVGDDGTGDIRVIVDRAIRDNPHVTTAEIVEIVRDARAEWADERGFEGGYDA